jgi:hypothetical protein
MTKLEFESILSQLTNLKNLPNNVLVSFMDKITTDFESTKQKVIEQTYHIDKLEETYNIILKEYQNRGND